MKLVRFALMATLAVGLARPSWAQNEAPAPAAAGTALFDVSNNACYARLHELDEGGWARPRAKGESRTGSHGAFVFKQKDLRQYKPDPPVFGLPLSGWNDRVLEQFYLALQVCTEPAGMKLVWGDKFLAAVKAELPIHIEEVRENQRIADQMNTVSSSAGIGLSCIDALDYPLQSKARGSGHTDEENYLPFAETFGKDFIGFTEKDYAFIRQKLADCDSVIASGSAQTGLPVGDISKLKKLTADMAGWTTIQAEQTTLHNAQAAAADAAQRQVIETDRRKNNPSFFEKFGDYLFKVGIFGFIGSGMLLAKKDGRFRTGYKNNKTTPAWVSNTLWCSLAMVLLGGFLGR